MRLQRKKTHTSSCSCTCLLLCEVDCFLFEFLDHGVRNCSGPPLSIFFHGRYFEVFSFPAKTDIDWNISENPCNEDFTRCNVATSLTHRAMDVRCCCCYLTNTCTIATFGHDRRRTFVLNNGRLSLRTGRYQRRRCRELAF